MVYYLSKPLTTAWGVPTVQVAAVGSNGNHIFLNIMLSINFLIDVAPQTTGSRPKMAHCQVMGAPPNLTPRSSGNVFNIASIHSLINESQQRGTMSSLKTNLGG